MNKVRTRTWEEARAELQKVATSADCAALDRALAEGRKVTAIRLLRAFGISVYAE